MSSGANPDAIRRRRTFAIISHPDAGKLAAALQSGLGDWHDAERLLLEAAAARPAMPALCTWLEARALAMLQAVASQQEVA